ncbi:unnamed protein product [Cyprideis torosa]|uniref:Uncharacterized protein n=1 Tax=Cyprideis torosa TaxID=163714 RepID=A0A7R8W847_9CRUS|nr:unnamed protein product [Cyprideis torosa]CAG0888248.1 unnamed protein product [Cyprideis torosa]
MSSNKLSRFLDDVGKKIQIRNETFRQCVAEFAGMFVLVFIGDCSVAQADIFKDESGGSFFVINICYAIAVVFGLLGVEAPAEAGDLVPFPSESRRSMASMKTKTLGCGGRSLFSLECHTKRAWKGNFSKNEEPLRSTAPHNRSVVVQKPSTTETTSLFLLEFLRGLHESSRHPRSHPYFSLNSSGGHMNPAVTLAMGVFGELPWFKVPLYMLSQYAGGFVAAAMVYVTYRETLIHKYGDNRFDVKYAGIFTTFPREHMTGAAGFLDQVGLSEPILPPSHDIRAAMEVYWHASCTGAQPMM